MKVKQKISFSAGVLLFLIIFPFHNISGAGPPGKADNDGALNAYGKLPLYFIENKGQLDPKVRFYVKTSGQTIYFTDEKIVFDLLRAKEGTGKVETGRAKKGLQNRDVKKERLVFNLGFENVQKGVSIEGLDRQDAGVNYFLGNDKSKWKTGISTYKGIIYQGVYKGIDLKVFGKGKDLEYEFVVNPGGNPNDILLTYNGIERLSKNGKGELLIGTAFGELKETKPYIYQEIEGKKAVHGSFEIRQSAGRFRTARFSYGFQIGLYNPSYPLIIDPTLTYSTYLGGRRDDWGIGIAVDGSGNTYVTGSTSSSDFPTQNPYQGTYANGIDAFIAKLSASGSALSYSTYLGGSSQDWGVGISVDSSGNAYITGNTHSSNFPTEIPFQENFGGRIDAFITKLSSSGNILVYSTYLGGSDFDSGAEIAIDGAGNAYVTGYTFSNDFPTQNPYQEVNADGGDAFVTKLSPSGNILVYSTYLGGSESDTGRLIVVDGSGNAYVTGGTSSSNFPTQNPYQRASAGDRDAFITKLSPSGNILVYSTYLGGSDFDEGRGIAVDGPGNAYVTGITTSSDFPTHNPFQGTRAGELDAFVTKLSSSGNALTYSTYLGGFDDDYVGEIAVDSAGNAYITGYTSSSDFPTESPFQKTLAGGIDAFITKLSTSGIGLEYSTYLGGSSDDYGHEIVVDDLGNAYVVGKTSSYDFPTKNPYQENYAGGGSEGWGDAFITKLSDTIPPNTPTPDIKANNSDGPIVVSSGTSVSIKISLNAGDKAGHYADWWIAVKTPFDPPADWYTCVYQSGWRPGINAYVQSALSTVSQDEVLNMVLPTGNYTFYFAIDDPDGAPTGPWWGLDAVVVTVQ